MFKPMNFLADIYLRKNICIDKDYIQLDFSALVPDEAQGNCLIYHKNAKDQYFIEKTTTNSTEMAMDAKAKASQTHLHHPVLAVLLFIILMF